MKFFPAVLSVLVSMVLSGQALQRSDLSPEAQALVPEEGGMMTIVTSDGKTYEGIITMESATSVNIKFKKPGGTIFQTVPIMKADIRKQEPKDVTPFFFEKLMEYKLDENFALSESSYKSAIALFDEFLQKAGDYPDAVKVKSLRADFARELENLGRGLKKVGAEWNTPVCGTIKEFDLITSQMTNLEARADFRTNPKVQEFHKGLVEKRRNAVRSLPAMVRATVPQLISSGQYETAVNEVISFMQFWCDQVVQAEGPAAEVIKQMDFGQIVALQRMIMESYVKAGKGEEGSAGKVTDKDMVLVPGGYFLMGREGGDSKSPDFPFHIVYVAPFAISKYEVTNKQYREFLDHVKKTGDSSMDHPDSPLMKKHDPEGWKYPNLSRDDQPVVGVDWFDAYAYAKWKGLRLPTEAEWEKAARTTDGRKFAWGEKAPAEMEANWTKAQSFIAAEMDRQHPPVAPVPQGGCSCVKKELPPPSPTVLPSETWAADKQLPQQAIDAMENEFLVWKKTTKCAYGIEHMGGNAAEWVYDFYDPQYYWKSPIQNPKGPETGKLHVFRGGAYLETDPENMTVYVRRVPNQAKNETGCMPDGRPFIGFRVVKDIGLSGQFHEETRQAKTDDKSFSDLMNELKTDEQKQEKQE